jgi:flavodoxin
MKIAVRFYSRSGNTKKLADAIAKAANVSAYSTQVPLTEPVDLLFLGGAVYAGNIDSHLQSFAQSLTSDQVKRVCIFSTAASGKSIHSKFEDMFSRNHIELEKEDFACRGKFLMANRSKPDEQDCREAAAFVKKILNK